jgi:hypothetical protein
MITTSTLASVEGYERALAELHAFVGNPLATIDQTLAEDPELVAGHALRAGLLITSTERRAEPELERTVVQAEALIARGIGNEREHAHVAAARAWLDRDFMHATDCYNRIALEHPRDMLAVQVSHICNFLTGRATWLRDTVAAALPHYTRGEPSYGFLLGMHAFGLEECGEYARAEQAGMLALEQNRRDAWAVHAVAHVLEMQGRIAEGVRWLEQREPDWSPENFFAVHNYWHLALFQLELGDHAPVLALYDAKVRGGGSEVIMDLVDASALLWRLQLVGVDVRERAKALAAIWRRIEEERYYAFNDWHALMAFAAAGERTDVERVLEGLRASGHGHDANALLARDVGLPACEGFAAFAAGDYSRAASALFSVRPFASRFGGSHAQRDILDLTLLEAALRSGQLALARGLTQSRQDKKPDSPAPLRMLARIYAAAGAPDSAASAAQQAEQWMHRTG